MSHGQYIVLELTLKIIVETGILTIKSILPCLSNVKCQMPKQYSTFETLLTFGT